MKKYVLAVLNPKTNQMHFGKPSSLEEVMKEAELFKNTRIVTEEEYQDIIKGFLYNEDNED